MPNLTKAQKEVLKIQYPSQYKQDPEFKGRWVPPHPDVVEKYKKGKFTAESNAINKRKKNISTIESVAKKKGVTPKQYLKSVGADTNYVKNLKTEIDSISTVNKRKKKSI